MARTDRNPPEQVLLAIAATMPERVAPACRHFGACGGCQLQHLPQPQQLAAKQAMLLDVLHRAGLNKIPELTVHAGEPYGYRNRARMRVEGGAIGYSRPASNEFLPIEECPIVSPLVWQAAATLQRLVREDVARWPVQTVAFELFVNEDESAMQLAVQLDATLQTVDRDAPRALRLLCDALREQLPQLAGAGLSVAAPPDPSQPLRVQGTQRVEIARWGDARLQYRVAGHVYQVTRNAFFQVNRFLTETMVRLVVADRRGQLAWDLFAGAGLFSVALAERFRQVVAVEIGEPAASDLAAHLAEVSGGHRGERSTALDFLRKQVRMGGAVPDLIVLDPPRAGLGVPGTQALIAAGAREVVYVSCDAGSFARDARALLESGYTLEQLHLLDQFPQTVHTETIAVFRR